MTTDQSYSFPLQNHRSDAQPRLLPSRRQQPLAEQLIMSTRSPPHQWWPFSITRTSPPLCPTPPRFRLCRCAPPAQPLLSCEMFALPLKLNPLLGVDTAAAYVQAMRNPRGYSVLHILPTTAELADGTHRVRSPCVCRVVAPRNDRFPRRALGFVRPEGPGDDLL